MSSLGPSTLTKVDLTILFNTTHILIGERKKASVTTPRPLTAFYPYYHQGLHTADEK